MVLRKQRTAVVLDTNVFVRSFKARSNENPNRRTVRLWLIEKKLQLIVSPGVVEEYLGIFSEVLGMDDETVRDWQARFEADRRSTLVNLGKRYTASRDPDDNVFLDTAAAGRANYLVTNDLDLLEIPHDIQRSFAFVILTPRSFLREWPE